MADMKDFNETVSALGIINQLLLVVHCDLSAMTVAQSFMRINDFLKQ